MPNVSQFPSSASGRGFAPLSAKLHAQGLKMGIWIGGGVPRMAVEARSRIKGTRWTAADIAILDGRPNKDGKATGYACLWADMVRFHMIGRLLTHDLWRLCGQVDGLPVESVATARHQSLTSGSWSVHGLPRGALRGRLVTRLPEGR